MECELDQYAFDERLRGQFAAQARNDAGEEGDPGNGDEAPVARRIVEPDGCQHDRQPGRGVGLQAGREQGG